MMMPYEGSNMTRLEGTCTFFRCVMATIDFEDGKALRGAVDEVKRWALRIRSPSLYLHGYVEHLASCKAVKVIWIHHSLETHKQKQKISPADKTP